MTSFSLNLNFSDAETPLTAGSMTFLQHAPAPPTSLQLFRNGILMSQQAPDYTITGVLLTFYPPLQADDKVVCWYRW
jgi:hypothetical protein